jgi:hypothetical protein
MGPDERAAQRRLDMQARGPSSYEQRACLGKHTHPTRKAARQLARQVRGRGHGTQVPYRCPHCGLFHLTTKLPGHAPARDGH